MLECVVNISEGRDRAVISKLGSAAGPGLVDVHTDPGHNRSVMTLLGPADLLESALADLARSAVALLDLSTHEGAHPRIGVLDVVPWVDLAHPWETVTPESRAARDRFAQWAGRDLGLPCFLYGPERSLPEVRRGAWRHLAPDTGPAWPHPSAGASAVGVRGVLVAYNLWLRSAELSVARDIARVIRGPHVRALGLLVGGRTQVSCNLIAARQVGPAEVYDAVCAHAPVERAELVGLIPDEILRSVPGRRWAELDLSADQTIEARITS